MRNPPTLLSLATDSALNNFSQIYDLSFLPEHILLELLVFVVYSPLRRGLPKRNCEVFLGWLWKEKSRVRRTLKAGKLNEKILKLFVATGKEDILSAIEALNIRHIMLPVLPTRCSEKF